MQTSSFRVGSLNCRGLTKEEKQNTLVEDITRYNLDVTALQETKINGPDGIKLLKTVRSNPFIFITSACSNSHHGVAFIVKKGIDRTFKTISNRLALLTIYRHYNNRVVPLYIINAYALTSQTTYKNPLETDIFYQDLENLINSINKKELIICGDFNAKTGSSNAYLPKHIRKI